MKGFMESTRLNPSPACALTVRVQVRVRVDVGKVCVEWGQGRWWGPGRGRAGLSGLTVAVVAVAGVGVGVGVDPACYALSPGCLCWPGPSCRCGHHWPWSPCSAGLPHGAGVGTTGLGLPAVLCNAGLSLVGGHD